MIAFFDYDDTISCGDSILYWNCFLFRERPDLRRHRWVVYLGICLWLAKIISTHTLKRLQLKATSYLSETERRELSRRFVKEILPQYVFPEMLARMQAHQEAGHKVVVVSASATFYMNQELLSTIVPCDEVVGTEMNFPTKGWWRLPVYTQGNFKGPHKVEIISNMEQFPEWGQGCYGYSDHYSDRFLLEYTEFPQVVNPDQKLLELAKENSWPIWRPYRHKNGRERSFWKLRMLIFAKGLEVNKTPSGLSWRSQQLHDWMESWKAFLLGEGEFQTFWLLAQSLKGLPLEISVEEAILRHENHGLPLIPTAQFHEPDPMGDQSSLPKTLLPYATWRPLKKELCMDQYKEVKIPVRSTREMMAQDRRFIELCLREQTAINLRSGDFFEARIERLTQIFKRDYQAKIEYAWYTQLLKKTLPEQLKLKHFKLLSGVDQDYLLRPPQDQLSMLNQVQGKLLDSQDLNSFIRLIVEGLSAEVMVQLRMGQVWSRKGDDWWLLDPNALTPLVNQDGSQFYDWLRSTDDPSKYSCFDGVDFSVMTEFGQPQEIMTQLFHPYLSQSIHQWDLYAELSLSSKEVLLGALNPFLFDLVMNLVELNEFYRVNKWQN